MRGIGKVDPLPQPVERLSEFHRLFEPSCPEDRQSRGARPEWLRGQNVTGAKDPFGFENDGRGHEHVVRRYDLAHSHDLLRVIACQAPH